MSEEIIDLKTEIESMYPLVFPTILMPNSFVSTNASKKISITEI